MQKKQKKTCERGHTFYKSSDCPTCPICEKAKDPAKGFLALLSNPARNALEYYGIDTLEKLSTYTEKEILALHGAGPSSLPTLKGALKKKGLALKK